MIKKQVGIFPNTWFFLVFSVLMVAASTQLGKEEIRNSSPCLSAIISKLSQDLPTVSKTYLKCAQPSPCTLTTCSQFHVAIISHLHATKWFRLVSLSVAPFILFLLFTFYSKINLKNTTKMCTLKWLGLC